MQARTRARAGRSSISEDIYPQETNQRTGTNTRNPRAFPCSGVHLFWCEEQDLNLHAFWATAPKAAASANSAILAVISLLLYHWELAQGQRLSCYSTHPATESRTASPPDRCERNAVRLGCCYALLVSEL